MIWMPTDSTYVSPKCLTRFIFYFDSIIPVEMGFNWGYCKSMANIIINACININVSFRGGS